MHYSRGSDHVKLHSHKYEVPAVIPPDIIQRCSSSKVCKRQMYLLVIVDSLCQDAVNGCWASNGYFARSLGVSESWIKRMIFRLVCEGLLTRSYTSLEGGGRRRHLWTGWDRWRKEWLARNHCDASVSSVQASPEHKPTEQVITEQAITEPLYTPPPKQPEPPILRKRPTPPKASSQPLMSPTPTEVSLPPGGEDDISRAGGLEGLLMSAFGGSPSTGEQTTTKGHSQAPPRDTPKRHRGTLPGAPNEVKKEEERQEQEQEKKKHMGDAPGGVQNRRPGLAAGPGDVMAEPGLSARPAHPARVSDTPEGATRKGPHHRPPTVANRTDEDGRGGLASTPRHPGSVPIGQGYTVQPNTTVNGEAAHAPTEQESSKPQDKPRPVKVPPPTEQPSTEQASPKRPTLVTVEDRDTADANRLYDHLGRVGLLTASQKYSAPAWRDHLRKLRDAAGEEMSTVLDWYIANSADWRDPDSPHRFTPRVYSAKSFREKYDRIRDAMFRSRQSAGAARPTLERTEAGRDVEEELGGLHWPKGAAGQIPAVIENSLAALSPFWQYLKARSVEGSEYGDICQVITRNMSPCIVLQRFLSAYCKRVQTWESWSGTIPVLRPTSRELITQVAGDLPSEGDLPSALPTLVEEYLKGKR